MGKYEQFVSPSFWFGTKNGSPTFDNSLFDHCWQVGKCFQVIYNKMCCSWSNENRLALEEAKATLVPSIFFVSCEEKDCYRDFSIGQFGFGSRSILQAQPVYVRASSKSVFGSFSYFWVGWYIKTFTDWPLGKQYVLFPSSSIFRWAFTSGNIEGLEETKLTVSLLASH